MALTDDILAALRIHLSECGGYYIKNHYTHELVRDTRFDVMSRIWAYVLSFELHNDRMSIYTIQMNPERRFLYFNDPNFLDDFSKMVKKEDRSA